MKTLSVWCSKIQQLSAIALSHHIYSIPVSFTGVSTSKQGRALQFVVGSAWRLVAGSAFRLGFFVERLKSQNPFSSKLIHQIFWYWGASLLSFTNACQSGPVIQNSFSSCLALQVVLSLVSPMISWAGAAAPPTTTGSCAVLLLVLPTQRWQCGAGGGGATWSQSRPTWQLPHQGRKKYHTVAYEGTRCDMQENRIKLQCCCTLQQAEITGNRFNRSRKSMVK